MKGRPKSDSETKSKRLNLLIKPSTYEKLDKIIYINRLDSVNSLVNEMLEQYVTDHADDVKRYDDFFNVNDKAGVEVV